jgi:hypothetical protein
VAKFQVGTVKKRYLNNKRIYEYKRISLNVARKFHKLVEPLLDRDFQVRVTAEKDTVTITLAFTDEKP